MVSAGINKDQIRRCVEATETAADLIRDGDLARRQVSLELRDLQLTMHEDFERLKKEINEFEAQVKNERIESGKWMNEKLNTAKEAANQAIKSNILLKDIQVLEKKVDILSESVINVNKAYYNYEKNVDVDDLMDQVREMAYRTEKKEKELLSMFSGPNSNKKIEEVLRGAVEGLLGLRSNNPALIEEARQLATELRVYRDAAANNNLMTLIGRYDSTESASSVDSKDSTFSKLSGSVYSSTKSDSTASSLSTSTVASNTESKKTSSQMSI